MPRMRHRIAERLRLIALIALLFVPIAFSGHQHTTDQTAQPCAVCLATRHTPVVSAPNSPVPVLIALISTVAQETIATPPALKIGRASCRERV